jgi:5'-AMP-activated protein kinase, catalytic alpha subunit
VQAAFKDLSAQVNEQNARYKEGSTNTMKPATLNAFDLISLSPGFDLSGLFEKGGLKQQCTESRYMTQKPASAIVSRLEEIAQVERFNVKKQDGMVKLQGCRQARKGQLAIDAEIFELTPSFCMIEVKKSAGDTLEYQNFCNKDLKPSLKDICWAWQVGVPLSPLPETEELARS